MNENPYQSPTAPNEPPTRVTDVLHDETPIVARYRWTADELTRGYEAHQEQQWRRGFRLALIVLPGALAGLTWLAAGASLPVFVGLGCAVGLYLAFYDRTFLKWRVRRQFRKRTDAGDDTEWRFTPDVIYQATSSSRTEQLWNTYSKMVESPSGVLLYPNPTMFHWIPRHAFASDLEYARFLQLAESRIERCHRVNTSRKRK